MISRPLALGIDTGGTYTDAVVLDSASSRVISRAKALTTRGDLALGVIESMDRALEVLGSEQGRDDIGLVCVSTTLATNAVVEGHGSPVAVVLIGFDDVMQRKTGIAEALPGTIIGRISGGHDHSGGEAAELDTEALKSFADEAASHVEAFAIASSFAVRNPRHELLAREIITATTGLPVTLSSELSSDLDAPRRALTATLNARLISRISALIEAVQRAMVRASLDCPLMMVKGDGSLALADQVALRPIETVLSGPAASVVGAATMSGLLDFILSDVGGTTTDLAIVESGRPRLSSRGAEVGGWRTMVRAIDVSTVGLGGDSEVRTDLPGEITVGPGRTVPVSLLTQRFPDLIEDLRTAFGESGIPASATRFALRPLGSTDSQPSVELGPREAALYERIGTRPRSLYELAPSSGAERLLASLKRRGLIEVGGFTPSDAALILGLQDNWSDEAAWLAARILVRANTMRLPDDDAVKSFAKSVWSETVRCSITAVLRVALGSIPASGMADSRLIDAVARGNEKFGLVQVCLRPLVPIVAVGGPARVYYEEAARRIRANVVYPEAFEVANAVGAASGVVRRTVTITVSGNGSGQFRVLGDGEPRVFTDSTEAIEYAKSAASSAVALAVATAGAGDADVQVTIAKTLLPDASDDRGLLEAVVRAEAAGRPDALTTR